MLTVNTNSQKGVRILPKIKQRDEWECHYVVVVDSTNCEEKGCGCKMMDSRAVDTRELLDTTKMGLPNYYGYFSLIKKSIMVEKGDQCSK